MTRETGTHSLRPVCSNGVRVGGQWDGREQPALGDVERPDGKSLFEEERSWSDLTFAQLREALARGSVSATHAGLIWRALYHDLEMNLSAASELSAPIRARIARDAPPPEIIADVSSADGFTRKFLLRLADGESIETVLMRFRGRFTSCVSTQAGCAMGCRFCATGQSGFGRHLRPGEIVTQVVLANRALRLAGEGSVRNVVLMGMGEPLHNYQSVMTAMEIISDPRGLNIGPRRITISTVGVVPAIDRFTEEERPYNLAVSLHATTDSERVELVPITARWPLRDLIAACRAYNTKTNRKIFFEWTLIAGKNDSGDHARRLAALLHGLRAHVNLIPLNPTASFAGAATRHETIIAFQKILRVHGVPSTVRQRRGIDMEAGCGQLKASRSADTRHVSGTHSPL